MILYIDTSSSFLYAGVVHNQELLGEVQEELGKDLSSMALPKIITMLTDAHVSKEDINKIIVVNGPGSFTGIRIGLTIAKTWAYSKNIPIIPISSLEAMALSTVTEESLIVPMIDARHDYVFGGIYQSNGVNVVKDEYLPLMEMMDRVKAISSSYVIVTKDNLTLKEVMKIKDYRPDILKIVLEVQTHEGVNAHMVEPDYLKKTEAEEKANG